MLTLLSIPSLISSPGWIHLGQNFVQSQNQGDLTPRSCVFLWGLIHVEVLQFREDLPSVTDGKQILQDE